MRFKPCYLTMRLQTDGQTDRQTDGQGDSSILVHPPNFVAGGITIQKQFHLVYLIWYMTVEFCLNKRTNGPKIGHRSTINKCAMCFFTLLQSEIEVSQKVRDLCKLFLSCPGSTPWRKTTLLQDHEYFIPTKFHQNPSSGSGEED